MLKEWKKLNVKGPYIFSYNFLGLQFVGIIFWALMFVDRELVLPKALDPYFPWWLNHLMHTSIMVSTFIEMILSPRKYPPRSYGLFYLTFFIILYLIWYVEKL